jgi:D-glycero-D-manno-heptose 1,7-bisphosphate phosphatase
MKHRRFVLLDRDGTIIEEVSYLADPRQIRLIPGAARALRDLAEIGLGIVVVTNQSAVGRGFFDEAQLARIHNSFLEMLKAEQVQLDGLYFCPHTPENKCFCRKPRTGLIEKASKDLGFNLKESIVVGDKASDIEMGQRVGATSFLVRTGYGAHFEPSVAANFVVDDLLAASKIIKRLARGRKVDA